MKYPKKKVYDLPTRNTGDLSICGTQRHFTDGVVMDHQYFKDVSEAQQVYSKAASRLIQLLCAEAARKDITQ